MLSDDVTRIELESRRRALKEYMQHCQTLRSENESLKSEKDQREMDALQIISFLRRDAERKDELIESLKGTIAQQRAVFAQQREEEAETQNQRFYALERKLDQEQAELQRHLDATNMELRDLQEFKEQKAQLEENMANLEQVRGSRAVGAVSRAYAEPLGQSLQPQRHCNRRLAV